MYLHLGYNKIVFLDEAIGIFDSDTIWCSGEIKFIPSEKQEEFLLYKSLILLKDGDIEYSKISVKFLFKRFRRSFRRKEYGR